MNADDIAALRAQARASGGGNFIRLDAVGEWCAGTLVETQTIETAYGPTEELVLGDVTMHDGPLEGVTTFRLSRSVPRSELGSDSTDPPAPGWSIYVLYQGVRTGKSGREYHAYQIAKRPPTDAKAAVAKKIALLKTEFDAAVVSGGGGGGVDHADNDIPFAPSYI